MSKDRFFDDVRELLEQNGAMGVNQISNALGVPLSTMQKYLDKDQTYFKKNYSRKWELPLNAANSDLGRVSSNIPNLIENQVMGMKTLMDTLMSQFNATLSLMDAYQPQTMRVAGKDSDVNPLFIKTDKKVKEVYNVFKKYMSVVPEEYQDLIKNVDMHLLTIKMGTNYTNGTLNSAITALFLEESDTLPDEVIEVLEKYQKGTE